MNSCTLLLKPRERLQEQQWSLEEAWLLSLFCQSPLPQGPALRRSPVFLWSPEVGCAGASGHHGRAQPPQRRSCQDAGAQLWSSFDTASGEAAPAS